MNEKLNLYTRLFALKNLPTKPEDPSFPHLYLLQDEFKRNIFLAENSILLLKMTKYYKF
jgi:hypothetical protein